MSSARSTLISPAPSPLAPPDPVAEGESFAALGVPARFVTVLAREGITTPFPIQTATLRDTLAGRDVLGRGRTGSGKTLAFVLPMLARLADGTPSGANRPRGLVLAPTRELATQIAAVMEPLAKAARLTVTTVFGGISYARQISALRSGVDILIACPGRLEDLIKQGSCRLDAVEVTVLDEADHMADLGFLPGVKRLMDATPRHGQRMLFSATLDNGVDILVKRYLTHPLTHAVDAESTPVLPANHHMLTVATMEDKNAVVRELAAGEGRRLLFTRTKHGAKRWAKQLTEDGVPAVDLHGNLNQNARDRNLKAFSEGQVRVLVATDIAARGIHVDDVVLVVHVDPPTEHKAYLHRSGRTARAGAGGDVVTLVLPNQRGEVKTLARQAGITPVVTAVGVGSPHVRSLVGPEAAPLPYTPVAAPPQVQSNRPRRSRGAAGPGQGRTRSEGGQGRSARGGGHSEAGGSRSFYRSETGVASTPPTSGQSARPARSAQSSGGGRARSAGGAPARSTGSAAAFSSRSGGASRGGRGR